MQQYQKIFNRFILAKAHLGKKEANPAMFPYIRGFRNESSIFDFSKTLKCCRHLFQFLNVLSKKRHHILFLNTKAELNNFILFIAQFCRQSAIIDKWTGGALTNWKQTKKTIVFFSLTSGKHKNTSTAKDYQAVCDSFPRFRKSRINFQHVRRLDLPNLLVVLDPNNNEYAIHEAYSLKMPTTAFVDADTPSHILNKITYPIPSNNKSIQFMYWVLNSMVLICKANRLKKKC